MSVQQVEQAAPLPRRRSRGRFLQQEAATGYLFIAPAIILRVVIAFFPIIQSIWYSLQNYIPTYPQFGSKFIGLILQR